MVTDLGTEFGVEVEKSGVSQAHVFEGKVELRAVGGGNSKAIPLQANESARVDFGKRRVGHRGSSERAARARLSREMPKSVPIVLFNTGVGLKEGDADPHWQLVARSDDPKFKPQPGRVRVAGDNALENDPARSQWLSLGRRRCRLAGGRCLRVSHDVRSDGDVAVDGRLARQVHGRRPRRGDPFERPASEGAACSPTAGPSSIGPSFTPRAGL